MAWRNKTQEQIILFFGLEQFIFPEIQEVHTLCKMLTGISILYKKDSPFSCSAASLRSGNVDPAMPWFRISLCSFTATHTHVKLLVFSLQKQHLTSLICYQYFTSLSLDSLCMLPGGEERSLYPETLKTLSLSGKLSSGVGGKP